MATDRVRGIKLLGATELRVADEAQLLAGLRSALANRVVGATAMNAGKAGCAEDPYHARVKL